ncbi:MAG: potassium/proton antiporter [Bacteroidales bacterium]|nr:potassium/proton antiporter [Bacteroidales bacterium]
MSLVSEHLLLLCSVLIFAAVLVTKVGSRYGVPSLLLFLLLGMVAGKDVLGVEFDDFELAENIGHFAMTIILFTAGMETSYKETRPVLRQGALLSTAGVLLTVLFSGLFIWLALGQAVSPSILGCFLLATVMGSTDSASVFSVLRSKKLHLRENLGPMLELESGSNDPMAYILTIVLTQLMTDFQGSMGAGKLVMTGFGLVFLQVIVGVAVGIGVGYAGRWILGRLQLASSPLYSILILSLGYFANGVAGLLMGNGLLALYITAITIGNRTDIPHRKEILSFFNGMTWLMQLVMFLMLGLLARPSKMLPMILPALLVGLFMMFVARPASVFLCLLPDRDPSFRAKVFTSWVGLKGAGPILFALCPVVAGLEGADDMFNIVFLITLFSLLLQGMTLSPVARMLRLSFEEDPKVETFGMEIPEEMGMLRDHTVTEEDLQGGATLRDLGLPHGIRVMMVRRGDSYLVPHGSMPLEVGDRLVIIMGDSDD